MDTKKQTIAGNEKGGRNDMSKLLVAGGGLVIGSVAGVVVGRNPLKPTASQEAMETTQTEEQPTEELQATEEQPVQSANATSQEQHQTSSQPTEPTPIDSHGENSPTADNSNAGDTGNAASPDEVAQQIVSGNEVDAADGTSVPLMKIGEPSTMYDMEGNAVNVYNVQFNYPELAGQQFVLADSDGDGVFDGLYTADGEPFSLSFLNQDGSQTSFETILANARLEHSDLEMMSHNDGSFVARNEFDKNSAIDDPSVDIVDTGNNSQGNTVALNENGENSIDGLTGNGTATENITSENITTENDEEEDISELLAQLHIDDEDEEVELEDVALIDKAKKLDMEDDNEPEDDDDEPDSADDDYEEMED